MKKFSKIDRGLKLNPVTLKFTPYFTYFSNKTPGKPLFLHLQIFIFLNLFKIFIFFLNFTENLIKFTKLREIKVEI
jgi:hypothetical protein